MAALHHCGGNRHELLVGNNRGATSFTRRAYSNLRRTVPNDRKRRIASSAKASRRKGPYSDEPHEEHCDDDYCWWDELVPMLEPAKSTPRTPDAIVRPSTTNYLALGPRPQNGKFGSQDWRAFRARLVALEQMEGLFPSASREEQRHASPNHAASSRGFEGPRPYGTRTGQPPARSSAAPSTSAPQSCNSGGSSSGTRPAPSDGSSHPSARSGNGASPAPESPPHPSAAGRPQVGGIKSGGKRPAQLRQDAETGPSLSSQPQSAPRQEQQQPSQHSTRSSPPQPTRSTAPSEPRSGASSSHTPPPRPRQAQGRSASKAPYQPHLAKQSPRAGNGSSKPLLSPGPASWAHMLSHPEPGCLLMSKGGSDSALFDRTVILITSHDDVRGSVGFVLNKASPMRVSELRLATDCAGFLEAFGSQRLQIGGPVHLDHVTVLHRYLGIAGSHRVTERLFTGGLPDAVRLVQAGLALPHDFNLMLGVSGWAPRQLANEMSQGSWHCIATSPDLVLPRRAPSSLLRDGPAARDGQDMWTRILNIAAGPDVALDWRGL